MKKINIAIDGVAGSGKGISARLLAERLGYNYLDTGAMYRATGLYFYEKRKEPGDILEQDFEGLDITFQDTSKGIHVYLNGEDREEDIRTDIGGNMASKYATHGGVRAFLVKAQQKIVAEKGWVAEGRDIGVRVMPEAEIKFYLTASVEERARRRQRDYEGKGIQKTHEALVQEIQDRDYQDMNRDIDPLVQLPEAIVIDTTHHTIEGQVDEMFTWVQKYV